LFPRPSAQTGSLFLPFSFLLLVGFEATTDGDRSAFSTGDDSRGSVDLSGCHVYLFSSEFFLFVGIFSRTHLLPSSFRKACAKREPAVPPSGTGTAGDSVFHFTSVTVRTPPPPPSRAARFVFTHAFLCPLASAGIDAGRVAGHKLHKHFLCNAVGSVRSRPSKQSGFIPLPFFFFACLHRPQFTLTFVQRFASAVTSHNLTVRLPSH